MGDDSGAPSSQVKSVTTEFGGQTVTYEYTYDSNGNITSVSDGTYTTTYVYDSANQLVRESNEDIGLTWEYTYDDAGNILSKDEYAFTSGSYLGGENYTYGDSAWGDLLTKRSGISYSYDAIGNLVDRVYYSYTWEHGRELATLTRRNGETWTFVYDANGMRTSRTNGSTTYNYVYNGGSLSQMTVDSNTLYFAYDASGRPMSVTYNGTNYYYVLNLQGDVVAILDGSGTAVVNYTYDAWGSSFTTTGSMASNLGAHNPLRYRGYVYDEEYALYYLQSRYYDPLLGRFLNADAFTSTGQGLLGNNMFAYCRNNPTNNRDPWGTFDIHSHDLQVTLGEFGLGGGSATIGLTHVVTTTAKALLSITAIIAAIEETQKYNDERGIYYVYVLVDNNRSVQYVGRTKDPKAREAAHRYNPFRRDLVFKIIARNLSYKQARGLEQTLMLYYHTINKNDPKNNQINGISPYNREVEIYIDSAEKALGYLWNQFSNDILNFIAQ